MHRLALLVTLVVGCTAASSVEPDEVVALQNGGQAPNGDTGASICKSITVTGSVFYNDLRSAGRFGERVGSDGRPGVYVKYVGDEEDVLRNQNTNKNYLGLLDGQIDIFEVDHASPLFTDSDCTAAQWYGRTSIAADGSWSWQGSVCDACNIDQDGFDDQGISIAVKVSLRKCDHPNQRCVSLRDPAGTPTGFAHFDDTWDGPVWERWIRSATVAAPKVVPPNFVVQTGTDYFQDSSIETAGVDTDVEAQAANEFATLVDVTRKVHLEENIPFDYPTLGEIKVYFPGVLDGSHSHQALLAPDLHAHPANRICIGGPGASQLLPRDFTSWTVGVTPAHEYGHLLHYWQWGGVGKFVDLCYGGEIPVNGKCNESDPVNGEYELNAFKEGWANFIRNMTFENTGSLSKYMCHDPAYSVYGAVLGGEHFRQDVTETLCNLRDLVFDDSPQGDPRRVENPSITLLDLHETLAAVWVGAEQDERDEITNATTLVDGARANLGICPFALRLSEAGFALSVIEATLAVTNVQCNF